MCNEVAKASIQQFSIYELLTSEDVDLNITPSWNDFTSPLLMCPSSLSSKIWNIISTNLCLFSFKKMYLINDYFVRINVSKLHTVHTVLYIHSIVTALIHRLYTYVIWTHCRKVFCVVGGNPQMIPGRKAVVGFQNWISWVRLRWT